ncbi:hypothetical protein SAMN04515671_2918 [Nakamurella panacisegetis]|uniref:Tail terminator n=1 Tax=Nakamurella panacisegetis TaxID=1090615 RepID=A0A1H0PWY4_9ACTN|nr:hypothetical protein [Nakamurella panacisegetis]SDP09205.1 hypothetical protein SAMN04515671_2918 [Nakamurella panacisegetis]
MSAEILVAPDPIAVAVQYLAAEFAARELPVTVAGRIPNPRPARLIRVAVTGGPGRVSLVVASPILTFDCWAESDPAASDLASLVAALVLAMPDRYTGPAVLYSATELSFPAEQPDPDTGSPRYVWSAQVAMRAQAI